MKKFIIVLIPIILLTFFVSNAQLTPSTKETKQVSKSENIKHLLKISGTGDYALIIIDDVMKNYRQMMTNVPPDYWDKAIKEIETSRFIDSVVVVYDKRFTSDEVINLISFFESPTGMKWAEQLGLMNDEVMQKASFYGNYVYNFINQKLITDKYINQPEIEVIKKDAQQNKTGEDMKTKPTEEQKSTPAKSTKKKK